MSGRAIRWIMSLAPRARNGAAGPRLTIVRHHRVYGDGERPLYRLGVSESVLAAQLDMLVALGMTPVTVAEGLAALGAGEPGHRVAMSFDDGYADNVTRALPLLSARGARATFYLAAGLLVERRAPWWDELAHALEATRAAEIPAIDRGSRAAALPLRDPGSRARALRALLPGLRSEPATQRAALDALRERLEVRDPAPCELATWDQATRLAEAGMELGAHTLSHPFLSLLDRPAQDREIAGSIDRIERRLGVRPRGLAYPGGDYDAASVAIARARGLEYAVTTRAGDVAPAAARFELPRRGLSDGACLGPDGRFSRRLARAELDGAFDRLRGTGPQP